MVSLEWHTSGVGKREGECGGNASVASPPLSLGIMAECLETAADWPAEIGRLRMGVSTTTQT